MSAEPSEEIVDSNNEVVEDTGSPTPSADVDPGKCQTFIILHNNIIMIKYLST